MMIKLLADENFPSASVDFLGNNGFDILSISISHPGISDTQVIELANKECRLTCQNCH